MVDVLRKYFLKYSALRNTPPYDVILTIGERREIIYDVGHLETIIRLILGILHHEGTEAVNEMIENFNDADT